MMHRFRRLNVVRCHRSALSCSRGRRVGSWSNIDLLGLRPATIPDMCADCRGRPYVLANVRAHARCAKVNRMRKQLKGLCTVAVSRLVRILHLLLSVSAHSLLHAVPSRRNPPSPEPSQDSKSHTNSRSRLSTSYRVSALGCQPAKEI
jgi:hypothetical protein